MPIDKLDLQSPDRVNENFDKLAALFPNCVTEGAEGRAIDFDLLKQELSHAVIEGNKERYRLEWPGKREAIVTANLPTTKTLRPVREDSVDFDNTQNLYIEGDNLEVLKLLQESYLGKIKMIYIDPPYNTGKDFVYKDNFSKDAQEELIESGQKDEYNQRLVANPETAGRYHSDWLSMMYPRLKLARNLLSNDGVIFISIDDNEVHNLKRVCDEIFGDSNFIANVIWERAFAPKNDAKYFSDSHDHILVFTKNILEFEIGKLERSEEANSRYKNMDDDPRGPWTSDNLTVKTYSAAYDYEIKTPSGRMVSPTDGRCWFTSKERMQKLIDDNRIWFGKDGNNVPRLKRFLSEVQTGMVPISIWPYKEVGHNQEGRQEVKKLFDDKGYFDGPKPVRLLSRILQVANLDEDSTVLDFFSGSGSLAHTVYSWNAENQERVSFIQVQLPEETDEKSEAYKAGYKNICEIGKERIRRAAKKIKEETNSDIDYGFRVYRLDSSNMQDVYYKPQDYDQGQLDAFADNVKSDRTAEDLLAQVMLDWGLALSLKITPVDVSGKKVFKVAENSLYACFDSDIDEDFAKAIAEDKPMRIVFRDSGFKNDTAKTNVKQLFKQLSPETEMKVI
ncbi:site-specific DNA-methyltransferase [Leeuwenhoekiella palythoae]|uniref:site-specific DNA-methyltransferase (adenine-specific) n=1 Tax=Leeuwenhoekiella palythoae TaxID=573501 RepID=A0A1M5U134_9FLAO|nr:site-specific DNA-methyltransferase [Leeuwenhoekiella palythoae]RXG27534.1 adenine-specific DNA-methyltransferase [Leeuwenhoekiella palythoae]SHH56664.1 adenine-specific DNA-methyltransferase [Leeuwenhoekiella palythoae]